MQETSRTHRRPARISVEVGDELHKLLQTEAEERSTPVLKVTLAQIVRETLYERFVSRDC
jgi:hypothetical protein